jgi:Na+/phosphate symporter
VEIMAVVVMKRQRLGGLIKGADMVSQELTEMLGITFEGFLRHSRKNLELAAEINSHVADELKDLTYAVLRVENENIEAKDTSTLVSIYNNLENIRHSIEKIDECVKVKINEEVLFSDKAVEELKEVFIVTKEFIRNLHDVFLTENLILGKHLMDQTRVFFEKIRRYSTEHEERLIKGVCFPKSSSLYLLILGGLNEILWNVKAICSTINTGR